MAPSGRTPRLLSSDLAKFIEREHVRRAAESALKAVSDSRLREAWNSTGGRAFRQFVDTRPAPTTRKIYAQHLNDYVLWLTKHAGGIDPLDATPEDLAAYELDVSNRLSTVSGKRLSVRTRQDRIRTLRTAYQFCVDEEHLDRSPARHLRVRGRAESKRTFLSDEEVVALLAACAGDRPSDMRDRSLITMLLHTGLRAAEAASLTWDALGGDDKIPTVTVEGKGRVVRTVPLSKEAGAALEDWAREMKATRRVGEYLWPRVTHRVSGDADRSMRSGTWDVTSRPLTSEGVHGIVTRAAARAGIKHTTPHTLRRTYATKLRDLGVTLDTIQRYLGHSSILTTASYFSPSDGGAAQTVRSMHYSTTPEA